MEEKPFVARLNAAPGPAPAPPPSGDAALQEKAPPATCTSCHDAPAREIEFHGLKMDHAALLGFGATCESCHQGVTAPPPVIEDGRCLECHTFGVERKLEAKEMHKVHTLGEHKIECSSCHGSVRQDSRCNHRQARASTAPAATRTSTACRAARTSA